ncbi:MAG: nucleotide exchange factor GrpE [Oscillospiraceae bacterium]|jgi:molecular chaperone GrpE (heat shock protein)|nr:nucleotide exchange factor GrpE [Oscillospiraceae bacterium]
MDFERELERLLAEEKTPPADTFAEIAEAQTRLADRLSRKTDDISLQIEEIYDIVKEKEKAGNDLFAALERESALVAALVGVSDATDGFWKQYQEDPDFSEPANILRHLLLERLNACGLQRLGAVGEPFDVRLHVAKAARSSAHPFECVAEVLETGFFYNGQIIRKASVIISKGLENE